MFSFISLRFPIIIFKHILNSNCEKKVKKIEKQQNRDKTHLCLQERVAKPSSTHKKRKKSTPWSG
jgi:hypothetical protein